MVEAALQRFCEPELQSEDGTVSAEAEANAAVASTVLNACAVLSGTLVQEMLVQSKAEGRSAKVRSLHRVHGWGAHGWGAHGGSGCVRSCSTAAASRCGCRSFRVVQSSAAIVMEAIKLMQTTVAAVRVCLCCTVRGDVSVEPCPSQGYSGLHVCALTFPCAPLYVSACLRVLVWQVALMTQPPGGADDEDEDGEASGPRAADRQRVEMDDKMGAAVSGVVPSRAV